MYFFYYLLNHYVIPHNAVLRPDSSTTKLRVVFNASAKSSTRVSLNNILMVGPTVQQDLILTLLSFRLYRHALTADVAKMYRQFNVDPLDRKFQLIWWRHNISDPLKLYQLNSVTYGLACAPFLAITSLYFIAEKYRKEFSIGSEIIFEGSDFIEDLKLKIDQVTGILSCGGLELAKWNFSKLDDNIKEHRFKLDSKDITKTLGMSRRPN